MQAVILAAGKSQRFYPFASLAHKSMLHLLGKPLLQHTLESLKKAKFDEVIIVVAPNSTIEQELEKVPGLSVKFVVQQESLGMGHALLQTEEFLQETFFLLSGYHMDIADFADRMRKMQKKKDDVVLLAKTDSIAERYGVLETEHERVLSVTEKPDAKEENVLRVIGIYLLNKTLLQTLKKLPIEHYHFEKALDAYAKTEKVSVVKATTPSITLKHSWDILTVKDYLLSKIKRSVSPKATIAKNAIIEGEVVISDGVKVLEGACIKGPCFLGENVVVGNNAILRNGVIVENSSVVGATMELKNSVLMHDVTTHTGFIGDSIVGSYSRLAAGFCSANVRFDRRFITSKVRDAEINTYKTHIGAILGEYVDTGINVSTMPGINIGNNVTIGPGTMVMENIEDNNLVYSKYQTVVKKKSVR